jgi:hypothetical protein
MTFVSGSLFLMSIRVLSKVSFITGGPHTQTLCTSETGYSSRVLAIQDSSHLAGFTFSFDSLGCRVKVLRAFS